MPTALERQGDFSQSLDTNGELIVIRDPLTGEPFPGNVIPPDRIHPFGPSLLSVLPEPNFFDRSISGGAYNYIFQDSGDNPKCYHSLRVDWRPTERDSFSWRGNRVSNDNRAYTGVAVGMPNWGLMYHHYNHIDEGMSLTYNRTFSPSVINELSL